MGISIESLIKRIEDLESEVNALKSAISKHDQAVPQGKETPAQAIMGSPDIKPEKRQTRPPLFDKLRRAFGEHLELSIGGLVIGMIGALAFIFGAGWFIKLAIERRWLNESARVMCSMIIGFLAIAASWLLANKKFRILPEVIIGVGHAVLYFAVFSAYYFYSLLSIKEAFIFLCLITAASTLLSAAARSQFLYIFSLIGAFLAPILMSQGENSYRFLFAYLTVFNCIFLLMSRKFSWKFTAYFLLISNAAVYFGWQADKLSESSFLVPFIFITCVFTIFMLRYYFLIGTSGSIHAAEHVLMCGNIAVYAILGHITIREFHAAFLPHFYLLISSLIAVWNIAYGAAKDIKTKIHIANWTIISLSPLMFATVAMFLKAPWEITAAIALTGAVSVLGSHQKKKSFTIMSILLWAVTVITTMAMYHTAPEGSWLVLNKRFYLYALSALFLALTFYFQRTEKKYWLYGFAALFLIILASMFESHDLFAGDKHMRQLSYSYVFLLYAFMLLIPGFKLSRPTLRFAGLSLFGIVIIKFYVYDMWALSLIIRIIAGFSLGIIFILTAVFYQKFRERLLKTMLSKKTMLLLLIIAGVSAANAEPVRVNSFKYYKDIIISAPIAKDQIYGTMDMDDEIYKYSSGYDLRVIHKGNALPYFITWKKTAEKMKEALPKVIFDKPRRESTTYILELPVLPEHAEYVELDVSVAAAGNYEMNIDLGASDDLKTWRSIGTYFIFKYSTASYNRLAFHLHGVKYLRLETASRLKLGFPKILSLAKKSDEYVRNVPLEEIGASTDLDKEATAYYYQNEKRKIISQISLNFKDGRFQRRYEIYAKSGKQYAHLMSGSVSQTRPVKQIINLIYPTQEALKILIINRDDRPLTLEKFTIAGPKEMLVCELPREENVSALRLYYGNRYIKPPDYDITNTFDKKTQPESLTLGKHTVNAQFSYSVIEPPVSIWILRVLFIVGFLSLLWPSYRIIKKYADEIQKKDDRPKSNDVMAR